MPGTVRRRNVVIRSGALIALAGLAATVAAILLLPWSRYGSLRIPLDRFPGWGWYAGLAIIMHGYAGWVVLAGHRAGGGPANRRTTLVVGLLLCAGTLAAAVALIVRYDDSGALLGPVVPMVIPSPGPGGPLALLGALATAGAIHRATRSVAVRRGAGRRPGRTGGADEHRLLRQD